MVRWLGSWWFWLALAGQIILYWPSLIGQKLLLPLDLLGGALRYLPQTPEVRKTDLHDFIMTDMVLETEPERQFAVSEIHAGRFPRWMPGIFAGPRLFYRWSFFAAGFLEIPDRLAPDTGLHRR